MNDINVYYVYNTNVLKVAYHLKKIHIKLHTALKLFTNKPSNFDDILFQLNTTQLLNYT